MSKIHPSHLRIIDRFGSSQSDNYIQTPVDYTKLSEGVPIRGHLSNGETTGSTRRCPKCKRVGITTRTVEGVHLIVHQGLVTVGILEAIDYCEVVPGARNH